MAAVSKNRTKTFVGSAHTNRVAAFLAGLLEEADSGFELSVVACLGKTVLDRFRSADSFIVAGLILLIDACKNTGLCNHQNPP